MPRMLSTTAVLTICCRALMPTWRSSSDDPRPHLPGSPLQRSVSSLAEPSTQGGSCPEGALRLEGLGGLLPALDPAGGELRGPCSSSSCFRAQCTAYTSWRYITGTAPGSSHPHPRLEVSPACLYRIMNRWLCGHPAVTLLSVYLLLKQPTYSRLVRCRLSIE